MDYQFSFTKKRFFLLVAAAVLAGFLIFAGGFVTGLGIAMPSRAQLAGLPANASPAAKLAAAKGALKVPPVPGQPALVAAATQAATTAAAAPAGTPPAAPAPAQAGSQAGTQAAPQPAAPAVSPTPAPITTAPAVGEPVAPPAVAAAATPNPADQPYVLQFGAFREQKSAKQLQATLKERGYATTIFNMVDEDQRTWHMVRFGGYKDLPSAAKAAADISDKEGIQALVRRSDSL